MAFNITSSFNGYLLIAIGLLIVFMIFRRRLFHELHKLMLKIVMRKKQFNESARVKGKEIVLGQKTLGKEEISKKRDTRELEKEVLRLKLKIEREIVEQKIEDPKLRNMIVERYANSQDSYVKNKLLALETNNAFHNEINKLIGGN